MPEYKNLVNEKLKTAEGLYHFLIEEFHQSRGFVLELMVVIILLIELGYLFHGKIQPSVRLAKSRRSVGSTRPGWLLLEPRSIPIYWGRYAG